MQVGELSGPGHFGDRGILLARRTATVRAKTPTKLWRLPRDRFVRLVRDLPDIGLAVATSLAERFELQQRMLIGAPEPEMEARPLTIDRAERERPWRWRLTLLAIAVAFPALLWNVAPPEGLDARGWHVLLVLAGAALAWLTEPVPDFAIALAMAAAWGIAGLAPIAHVFGGFATGAWILALGGLTLAAAMARSGLLFRAGLFLLRSFPATHAGQSLALILGGAVLTPFVPQSVARVAAIAPVTSELAASLGHSPRSRGSAALAFAGFIGYWYFSSIFLTGLAMNFFVFDLIPGAERERFGFWGWLAAASVTGVVSLVLATVALFALFRPERTSALSRETLHRQLRVMAGLSRAERVTLVAVAILVVGLLAQPILRVEPAWLAVASLVVAVSGVLGREQFRTGVDWPFLVLLGTLLGSGPVLQDAGIDRWLAGHLAGLGARAAEPALVVVGLAVLVVLVRLVLPSRPTMLLMSLVAMPLAPSVGISPWVAGFVVLLAANTWILPYQGLEYLVLRDGTRGEAFTDRQGAAMGAALTAIRVIAIAASVPYWTALGLVR